MTCDFSLLLGSSLSSQYPHGVVTVVMSKSILLSSCEMVIPSSEMRTSLGMVNECNDRIRCLRIDLTLL
jgi:hypothetical protein